jgi:hypothetical protein
VLEQLPEISEHMGLALSTKEYSHGLGVLRHAGCGFMEANPWVRPGMVVRFKQVGHGNPVISDPLGGPDLTAFHMSMVTGVDPIPLTDLEMLEWRGKAADLAAARPLGAFMPKTEAEIEDDMKAEAFENTFNAVHGPRRSNFFLNGGMPTR